MDNIRIGNTFEVSWAINQFNGTETVPYDLAGKDLTLILANALSKVRVEKFSVIGNIISFTFEGKDQRHAGKYSLILIENNGVDGMHIVDVCDAFRLVNRSCETCDDPSSIVDCTHIDFASTMLSRRGISAYEYAKLNGYEGTEEEYAADCRAIPELKDQVQEIVDKAAEDIQAAIESFDKTLQGKQDTIEDLETIRSGAAKGATAVQPSDIPTRLPNPLALNYSINGMSGVYTGEYSVYWPSIYAPASSGAAGYVVEGGNTEVKWTKLSTINGKSLLNGEDIVIEDNSKIILDFEKLGEPIEVDEEGMEMIYSKEQFENAVGMSMSEFIEKIKTSELVLSNGVSGMNSYYVVADEYTWAGYYKIPGPFNYVLSVDATPSEEKIFVGFYDESVDLPFATTEYVDEKHAKTETKLAELSEEIDTLSIPISLMDLASMKRHNGALSYPPCAWFHTNEPTKFNHIVLAVKEGDSIFIQDNGSGAYMGFLKTYNVTEKGLVEFSSAEGYNARLTTSSRGKEYIVPSDAQYFVLCTRYNSESDVVLSQFLYNGASLLESKYYKIEDNSQKIEDNSQKIEDTNREIQGNNKGWRNEFAGALVSSGKWGQVTNADYTHIVLSVAPNQKVSIIKSADGGYLGFLRSYSVVNNEMADFSKEDGFTGVMGIRTQEFVVPSDVRYLVIDKKYGTGKEAQFEVKIDGRNPIEESLSDRIFRNNKDIITISRNKWMNGLNVAYSSIGIAPINTAEHFITAAKLGFNALKADVAVTSDNVLICCHDAGFTLDGNGRITSYNSADNTPINSMTWEQISQLEYAANSDRLGHYAKVCTIEDFIKICLEFGKIPYITIRGTIRNLMQFDIAMPMVIEMLKKYNLLHNAILNKFDTSKELCQQIRDYNSDVNICYTLYDNLTREDIDFINSLGNACIAINYDYADSAIDAIEYAKTMGIPVMAHGVYNETQYRQAINRGLLGGQIGSPILPYSKQTIALQVEIEDGELQDLPLSRVEGQKYAADITWDAETMIVTISNLKLKASGRYFADGVMPLWMNVLPYSLDVKSNRGYAQSKLQEIWWEKSELALKVKMASNYDLAQITIEV